MSERRLAMAAIAALVLLSSFASGMLETQVQTVPQAPVGPAAAKTPGQGTVAAPRPAQERMAVGVLLAWVWLSIAVLLGLLRLRVREADRVFRFGLDRAAGQTDQEPKP